MNSFQTITRKEVSILQNRMSHIEELMEKVIQEIDKLNPGQSIRRKTEEHIKIKSDHWSNVISYIKVTLNKNYRRRNIMRLIVGY